MFNRAILLLSKPGFSQSVGFSGSAHQQEVPKLISPSQSRAQRLEAATIQA
jgi:hypothetical protein